MEILQSLVIKLLPLYGLILLGFLVGKYTRIKKEMIAAVAIFGITPVVVFHSSFMTPVTAGNMSLPILVFIISCGIALLFLRIGKIFWKDSTKNALAFIAPEANVGYFGLPVAMLLLDASSVELYIFAALGLLLYENTLGVFIAARGRFSVRNSFLTLLRLPAVYAVIVGLLAQLFHVHLGLIYAQSMVYVKYLYTIFGMMIIGLGLSAMEKFSFDRLFVGLAFLAKFIVWPLTVACLIIIDSVLLRLYGIQIHKILLLISIMPIAANTVALTTFLKIHPEKVAVAVVASTLFALIYIPCVVMIFFR